MLLVFKCIAWKVAPKLMWNSGKAHIKALNLGCPLTLQFLGFLIISLISTLSAIHLYLLQACLSMGGCVWHIHQYLR